MKSIPGAGEVFLKDLSSKVSLEVDIGIRRKGWEPGCPSRTGETRLLGRVEWLRPFGVPEEGRLQRNASFDSLTSPFLRGKCPLGASLSLFCLPS
jgi:hypothetical protein